MTSYTVFRGANEKNQFSEEFVGRKIAKCCEFHNLNTAMGFFLLFFSRKSRRSSSEIWGLHSNSCFELCVCLCDVILNNRLVLFSLPVFLGILFTIVEKVSFLHIRLWDESEQFLFFIVEIHFCLCSANAKNVRVRTSEE